MRTLSLFIIFSFFAKNVFAQADLQYLDKGGYVMFYGGPIYPGDRLSSDSESGLFAENGVQFGIDLNYVIAYGIGVGFNYEYNNFGFNQNAFLQHSGAQGISYQRNYTSNKFGLNVLFNVPLKLGSDDWVINLFAKGNAGLRTMNIPEIDLTYSEIMNKYVEVSYRPRANLFGYLGYTGGLQFMFLEKYGINFSYNHVLNSRHSIQYSSRRFDAQGNLTESEPYLNDNLDHYGFQIGFMILMGR